MRAVAARARDGRGRPGRRSRADKDAALHALADALVDATDVVLTANARDVASGREAGLSDSMLDRLALTRERIAAMATGLRDVAALPDPVGEVLRGYTQPNGLVIRQLRVPFGVLGDHLRGPSERHRRRRRPGAQERQRGAAARLGAARTSPTPRWSRCWRRAAEKAGLPRDVDRSWCPAPIARASGTCSRRAAWST